MAIPTLLLLRKVNSLIRIENLTKIFNEVNPPVTALEDVSIHVERGDIFGIIGMSGAGKSTLLRCLCMLETPTSGRVLLEGADTAKLNGKELIAARRKMGIVFQGYNLLMQKSVHDNIAFPLTLEKATKAEIDARVAELLELVGLSDKSSAFPSQLSGGQKQRVAIARALATRPDILLCDEPTSALDSFTTKAVLKLLKRINETMGVTIVIITHEMGVVKAICNCVAVIDNSHFVESGNTKDVFENPQNETTKLLLGDEVLNIGTDE
ncbi:MAG: ATP-binding cassette domain-containing protein [Clostridia bacterium]|nr:ATP-binding cassette domain-containing protein [Clostridia bacterium]NLS84236.1 ATP-binding cassette domain-containing protein [Oscillospiraceae bacterium]